MANAKVAVTLDARTVTKLDRLIKRKVFPNRSKALQQALREKLQKLDRTRLARECAKLDPKEEVAMAEEGMAQDAAAWPKY